MKEDLHCIRFSYAFVLYVFSFPRKSMFFYVIFIRPYPHSPDCHKLNKRFPKKVFCKEVQPYFEISLWSFKHKIFEQNFCQYATVYLVRIWTCKNANEKVHTFSWKSKHAKNGQKGKKNGYCVNSLLTL